MLKWEDRKYVNARKRVFKNLDTNEILNLEIQDDTDNILEESETPLTAHNLNLAQKELLDDICISKIIKTTQEIAINTNYTIPINYKVGNDSLEIFYMGEKLRKSTEEQEGHYKEIGTEGEISNIIQFHNWGEEGNYMNVPINRFIEFKVRGDYSEQT